MGTERPRFARDRATLVAVLGWLTAASPAHAAPTPCQLNLPPTMLVQITGTIGDLVVDGACQHVYATNTTTNKVEVIDLDTGELQSPIQVGSKPVGLDVTPDGQFLYVANSGGNNISVVDLVHRVELRKITVPAGFTNDTPYWIAIASNGLALFSPTFGGSGFGAHLEQLVLATDAVSVRTDFWYSGTTTEVTRLVASADRTAIGVMAGDISSGPVFKYTAATNTFSPEKDLNVFLSGISLDATGSTFVVNLGTFVLDGALSLAGTIPPVPPQQFARGGTATSPDGTLGYRVAGATVEFLDLAAFTVIGSRKLLDTTDTAFNFSTTGLMDLSDDGTLLAIITDHGVSLVRTGSSASLVLPSVTLNFAVVRAGSTIQYATPGQDVVMTQSGGTGQVDWIALRDVPWLSTSPTDGTGPGPITFSINSAAGSLASGSYLGHIWIYTDGAEDPALVPVKLTVKAAGTARAPVGVVDTPDEWNERHQRLDGHDRMGHRRCRRQAGANSEGADDWRRIETHFHRQCRSRRRCTAGCCGVVSHEPAQHEGRVGLHDSDEHASAAGKRLVHALRVLG